MGHDHHFLSRLDRVDGEQTDVALTLYRDAELVRAVLAEARVSEQTPRIAISLGDARRGPFVVVTRDGHFVTCLGTDMRPHWPVVTRERLDTVVQRTQRWREGLSVLQSMERKQSVQLMLSVFYAGDRLAREDFETLLAVAPLLRRQLLQASCEDSRTLADLWRTVARLERPLPRHHELLRHFWSLFHSIGHSHLLTSVCDDQDAIDALRPSLEAGKLGPASLGSAIYGHVGRTLRALCAVPPLAPIALPACARYLPGATGMPEVPVVLAELGTIGLADARHAGEVRRVLSTIRADGSLRATLASVVRSQLDNPESARLEALTEGASRWMARVSHLPVGHPLRPASLHDVPVSLAGAALVTHDENFLDGNPELASLFVALPWIARARPEELYLPRRAVAAVIPEWTPQRSLDLVASLARAVGGVGRRPVRAASAPGRNEACACGSGRKYKRCCARVRAA